MKKKVLFRIGSLREGGAERALVNLLNSIDKNAYEIDLLLNVKFGNLLPEVPNFVQLKWINNLNENKNPIFSFLQKLWNLFFLKLLDFFPTLLYKIILDNKTYDVEIGFNQNLAFDLLKSPFKNSKKIIWIHTDIFRAKIASQKYIDALKQLDKIVVVSNGIKEEILEKTDISAQKIEVIYNIINQKEILAKMGEPCELNFPNQLPIFCAVGSLLPVKAFDRLIKIQKKLIDKWLGFNLVIVGEGEERKNLEKTIKDLSLHDFTKLVGYQKNPYKYMNKADVFVHTSHYEGFGNVLIEAMIVGKPILATNFVSAKEILENGKLGLIVNNTDEDIEKGICKLLDFDEQKNYLNNIRSTFVYQNTATEQIAKIIDEQ